VTYREDDEMVEELELPAFPFGINRGGYAWRVAGQSGHLGKMLLHVL
jgi:hypothetical protein